MEINFGPLGSIHIPGTGDDGPSDGPSTMGGGSPYPPPVDYSDAMGVMSNNDKTVALAQVMGQEFAIQQAGMNMDLQAAANLELGLENLDTKLQMGKMDFVKNMTAESNRHAEKLAGIAAEHAAVLNGGPSQTATSDIPSPDFLD